MKAELDKVDVRAAADDGVLECDGRAARRCGVDQAAAGGSDRQAACAGSRRCRRWSAQASARFVELAPGRTLAGLAKRINRRLPVESLATATHDRQVLRDGRSRSEVNRTVGCRETMTEKRVAFVTGGSRGIGAAIVQAAGEGRPARRRRRPQRRQAPAGLRRGRRPPADRPRPLRLRHRRCQGAGRG